MLRAPKARLRARSGGRRMGSGRHGYGWAADALSRNHVGWPGGADGSGRFRAPGWARLHRLWPQRLIEAPRYQRGWLRGDLIAGLTVAAYLIPQVMAYAGVAGLPPVTGLWAAPPALLAYALIGSSRSLSMGPESTTALMTAVAIAPLAAGNPARYAALSATLALLVGGFAILAGLARLGFVADLLSRPVLTGYLAGLALIMIAGQLGKTTGVPVTGESFMGELVSLARGLPTIRPATVALAAAVLIFLFALQHWWPRLPGPLLAVVAATVVAAAFGLAGHGIAVAGTIPSGLPPVSVPALRPADVRDLLGPAASVLLVAFSDEVLTARSFASRDELIHANQELVALGVANVAVSFTHGFNVSSSASRTAIGQASGSKTQLCSVTAAVTVLFVLLLGHKLLAAFPAAALGAIVIYAAIRLIDVKAFRRLLRFRRSEFLIAIAAMVGVLIVNILYGVLIAIGLSVAELLWRVARPHDAILGQVPGLAGMHDVDDYPEAVTIPGLVVYRYDAPLFFANAEDFRRRALAAASKDARIRWFVLNVEANVEVDFTALEAVEAVRTELASREVVFALARVKQDLLDRLESFGLAAKVGKDLIFPTLPTAVDGYIEWAATHPPAGTSGTA